VALSNLQRQVLYGTADVGAPKAEIAAARLSALNPHVVFEPIHERVTAESAGALVERYDVVLDGTDDFETRFEVNAACVAAGRLLVAAALGRWTGQVGVFAGRPCWRCLVPEAPPEAETCSAVGVIGALSGVLGSMAALEAIKLLARAGEPLVGRLLIYDGLAGTARTVRVEHDPDCPVCGARGSA
jgi:molybdopterin/thiamine biosynthesis adenylyltransferase